MNLFQRKSDQADERSSKIEDYKLIISFILWISLEAINDQLNLFPSNCFVSVFKWFLFSPICILNVLWKWCICLQFFCILLDVHSPIKIVEFLLVQKLSMFKILILSSINHSLSIIYIPCLGQQEGLLSLSESYIDQLSYKILLDGV